MKKALVLLLVIICLIILIMNPDFSKDASAANFSLGLSTWYAWWNFSESDLDMNPTILYGPALSLGFEGPFSLSGVFLYGKFKPKNDFGPEYITRFDSDVSLNYNINRYFKIFGGAKYMDFRWDERDSTGKHYSIGPGLGAGLTIPMISSFYFLANLSGTYTLGKHEQENNFDGSNESTDITETGINTNISVAYYIAPASTSVTFGFRYHYVMTKYDNSPDESDESFQFYGPTLSVVYTF